MPLAPLGEDTTGRTGSIVWTLFEMIYPDLERAVIGNPLEHHLIVDAKLTGRQKIHGTAQGDRFEFEGPYTDTVEAELHRMWRARSGSENAPAKRPENG